jgi:hypothetical protein
MDNREIRAQGDRAEWQIILGVTAGVGVVVARIFSAFVLALGDSPNYVLATGAVVEAGACAWLAWRVRVGSVIAASALFAIWLLGFLYAWLTTETGLPPFLLISLLIAIGLVQGILGTLARRRVNADLDAAA